MSARPGQVLEVHRVAHLHHAPNRTAAARSLVEPRRHRVAVGLYAVFTASRTGASVETVLDLADEYLSAPDRGVGTTDTPCREQ